MVKKVTPKLIAKAKEYALCGFSHLQIAKSVGIANSTLYADSNLMDTIREAESELREQIANDIKASSGSGEVSAQIFLSKRLNLYQTQYKMPQIKSVKTALTQISRVNSDLADGTLPPELANNLIKNIETFIKAYEVSTLEERIIALENQSATSK